ncbi:hypothetical protein CLH62_06975 [Marinobacter guineae]|uniref:DUF488 domain-containing protein n=1 Tax=Marinobacter guineae TaxID=432303 RepID=A0A2G1VKN0_9GAMM|nr:hypothetical protein [Marinobacter guineae]PHQ27308.1 hypothetical protein CLH62_06975 [Marinobacter guineae]
MDIRLNRAYEAPVRSDGPRELVDRIWPRGVAREEHDRITLVFAEKDTEHNNAVALKEFILAGHFDPFNREK